MQKKKRYALMACFCPCFLFYLFIYFFGGPKQRSSWASFGVHTLVWTSLLYKETFYNNQWNHTCYNCTTSITVHCRRHSYSYVSFFVWWGDTDIRRHVGLPCPVCILWFPNMPLSTFLSAESVRTDYDTDTFHPRTVCVCVLRWKMH